MANPHPSLAVVNIWQEFGNKTLNTLQLDKNSQLSVLTTPLIWNIYILAGIAIFFVLIYGGFMYIMGAGQADNKKIDQGKQAFTWGLIGLIIVFSSFWIIQIVKIITGLDILSGEGL
jgi:heme/copper-type cytochrome/quinol oxidase subunit 4